MAGGAGGSYTNTEPVILDYFQDAEAHFMPYFIRSCKEAIRLKPGQVGSVSFEDVMQAGEKLFRKEEFSATTIAEKMSACFAKSKEKKNGQFHAITECGLPIIGRFIWKNHQRRLRIIHVGK